MKEFIYNIEEIFGQGDTSCLKKNQVDHYYIAPYQRGYKWASNSPYDQVPQLLVDLYKAYSKGISEYYLQYITVKRIEVDKTPVFEVIDGQQRLTTLSLLFYRLNDKDANIANKKLEYSRYSKHEVVDNIFKIVEKHIENTPPDLDSQQIKDIDNKIQKQDEYYLVRAARCIDCFGKILKDNNINIDDFVRYIRKNVLLIFNIENSFTPSEEIFANLNDNKVSLSNAELIKGLLLTKAVRRKDERGKDYNYLSIIDQRISMGRMWDEIASWINSSEVSLYFFKTESHGLEMMLNLILPPKEFIEKEDVIEIFRNILDASSESHASVYELYNRFNTAIESTEDAIEILKKIKFAYRRLRHIYEDNRLYNRLGYVLFCKGGQKTISKEYITISLGELDNKLKNIISNAIPKAEKIDSNEIDYSKDNQALHKFLLALSVFPEENNIKYRFDFCSFYREKWTLEHISPQNPPDKIVIPNSAKQWVCSSILNQRLEKETSDNLIRMVNDGEEIEVKNIIWLYRKDDFYNVDSIGNMALLGGGVNSGLSNQPYVVKRKLLFDKINAGYFVPKHTIDVFSKVLSSDNEKKQFSSDFVEWNQQDVEAHIQWMKDRLDSLNHKIQNS